MNNITYETLIKKIKTYIKNKEKIKLIEKAYNLAHEKHYGQFRRSGEAYIIHPLSVTDILTNINADYETLCAALLHDVVEDCNVTLEEIEEQFGPNIRLLVDGVTKINKLSFGAEKEAELANQRKILVGLADDVRVIIVKLADRLHNMRTLWAIPEHRQKAKAKETLDILVPIAHRLGMYKIKSELEDLSLRYYKPDVYFGIVESLNNTKQERDNIVNEMLEHVSSLLKKNGIKHEIKGRAKSIYSIYKKMDKGKSFNDIYDLNALRVFVHTIPECYQALGIVHSVYKPMPKRFKDYIAMPKSNMYQSLHTTVFGNNGYLFEIQFRTYEMDEIAENGIASHWSYKEGNKKTMQDLMEQKLMFFKSIMELKEEEDCEFVESVKQDVFENTIYVFTPLGNVIELPQGSTPLDFAYKVHTDVGNQTVGAIVNDNIVPLNHELKSNDIVKINTNKQSVPKKEWINIVKTHQAKNKIKNYFNKLEKNDFIKKGEDLLKDELRRKKIPINEFLNTANIEKIINTYKLKDINDLYTNIGSNKILVGTVINIIVKENETKEEIVLKKIKNKEIKPQNIKNDIIVRGIDNIKTTISSCCTPIPGDRIMGYITKGNGISVHTSNCPNIRNSSKRLIDVTWNSVTTKKYPINILITTNNNKNILVDIIAKTTNNNIVVNSINMLNENTRYKLTILVENKEMFNKFVTDLNNIPNVLNIERLIQ
ncbi:MAG: bifunctional (p)ppGpp synthetase/guanosine-3',5'-bis(diphosphate) 3'-pyrophosphohydrolase [Bacilli bacterium]|nr:bifunctional (p)ppGpp synthetase/guanosine-3',5'-bis(diphosphate) 3'-pyrophosphohydrolase [Bacilli bacterium]